MLPSGSITLVAYVSEHTYLFTLVFNPGVAMLGPTVDMSSTVWILSDGFPEFLFPNDTHMLVSFIYLFIFRSS